MPARRRSVTTATGVRSSVAKYGGVIATQSTERTRFNLVLVGPTSACLIDRVALGTFEMGPDAVQPDWSLSVRLSRPNVTYWLRLHFRPKTVQFSLAHLPFTICPHFALHTRLAQRHDRKRCAISVRARAHLP